MTSIIPTRWEDHPGLAPRRWQHRDNKLVKAEQATGASSKAVTCERSSKTTLRYSVNLGRSLYRERIFARQEGKDGLCENLGHLIRKRHHAAGNLDHGRTRDSSSHLARDRKGMRIGPRRQCLDGKIGVA